MGSRLSSIAQFTAFLVVFIGAVLFYVFYGGLHVVDSILFVIITVTTIGYSNDSYQDSATRLFTSFFMVLGILFIFTYVQGVVHGVGRSIRRYILPPLKLHHSTVGLIAVSTLLLLCVVGVGTAFIAYNEGYDFPTSLYFVVYTATTVGYGGVRIKHTSTKIFLMVYALIAPITLAFTFDAMMHAQSRAEHRRYAAAVLEGQIPVAEVMVDLGAAQRQKEGELRQLEVPLLERFRGAVRRRATGGSNTGERSAGRDGVLAASSSERQPAQSPGRDGIMLHSYSGRAEAQAADQSPLHQSYNTADDVQGAPTDATHRNHSSGPTTNQLVQAESLLEADEDTGLFSPRKERVRLLPPLRSPRQRRETAPDTTLLQRTTTPSLFPSLAGVTPSLGAALVSAEGRSSAEPYRAAEAGTVTVSKAEFILSVLLRLGKLDYDQDVHVWANKFDALDEEGCGHIQVTASHSDEEVALS